MKKNRNKNKNRKVRFYFSIFRGIPVIFRPGFHILNFKINHQDVSIFH